MSTTLHTLPLEAPENFSKIVLHPSIRWVLPSVALAAVVAAIVRIQLHGTGREGIVIPLGTGESPPVFILPIFLLVLLVLLARPMFLMLDAVYTIGRHHIYELTGRLSLRKKFIEVPYEDMRGVRYEQNILERMLNIGSIVVWTATAESAAILMRGIANPYPITEEIRARIDAARQKGGQPNPGQDMEDLHRRAS